jgi:hypothetical protein
VVELQAKSSIHDDFIAQSHCREKCRGNVGNAKFRLTLAGICESYSFMETNTSKTPKTDSEALWPSSNDDSDKMDPSGAYVSADFAREMEKILRDTLATFKTVVDEVTSYGPDESDDEYYKLIKRAEDFLGKS